MKQYLQYFSFTLITLVLAGTLLHPQTAKAQKKYTISGFLKEEATGESMIGANVYISELLKGTTTNKHGFYSLTLEEGNYTLVIKYLGFADITNKITLDKNIRLNVEMKEQAITTGEVVITGERPDQNIQSTEMGTIAIPIEKIKLLPAFLGEVDILKTIQLLPGVQSAGEGNSGFYVRGGGPDQNLILLDDAVVYNASHLFGFFSIFNADAVKNIELIKGGMPANYGGRLSSVLDITMKEGNSKRYQADGGIGIISSRLTVQGPIKKDTSSFIISGRRTYIDVLMQPFKPLVKETSPLKNSGYYFYDLTTKINYAISDKDRIFLSGYFGRDVFNINVFGFGAKILWGNATTSLRWNHLFNNKLFMRTSAIFSDYYFEFSAEQSQFEFKLFSGITDLNAKV
ncbi:carboxypeptidase-like regulatory domain-containing protein, partial [bacterium AH-315-M05]|nr:carboxypeptidase-like regulatory domain-containing protein [bacterium AH-315-M05]